MCKKILCCLLLFCLLFQTFSYRCYADSTSKQKVLIVYDRENIFGYNENFLAIIQELMGAFNTQVDSVNVSDYKPDEIKGYDVTFVLSIDGEFDNLNLIKDLSKDSKKFCWIGKGIDKLLKINTGLQMSYMGEAGNCSQVFYSNSRGNELPCDKMDKFYLNTYDTFTVLHPKNNGVKVLSYVSDGINHYPFVLNENNFWYVSKFDDNFILECIFSDILHDIFSSNEASGGKVFIRIEDVHPFTDADKLKKIADYLNGEGVPFMIALTPAYVDPKSGYITTLSEYKDFTKAVQYMQSKGGSVILHGYTHQFRTGTVTGEGYEFWDDQKNSPLAVDMKEYVSDRVGKGIISCVENNIYPLGFEAPHYAIDSRGYTELKKYFSTYTGQFQSSDKSFTVSSFPYELNNTEAFNRLLPENMGYIDSTDPMTIMKMEEYFRQVSIVRGYTAGLFFHPYLDLNYLKTVVTFLKSKDVSFLDLKQEDNWVKYGSIKITSHNGVVSVTGKASTQQVTSQGNNYISKVNMALIIIVAVFCLIFIILFLVSKKLDKNKFLR